MAGPQIKQILVFGMSGALGRALIARRLADASFTAVSRQQQSAESTVTWLQGSLEQPPAFAGPFDAILSLGPLDAFAGWFEGSRLQPSQVIALGSTSVHSRADSPDADERDQAARLGHAEAALMQACSRRGVDLQLLRPTLIYGGGQVSGLARLVALARRHGFVLLPRHAQGLRQPVHVEDLAQAIMLLLGQMERPSTTLDLPGGEALAFDEMLRRTLAAAAPAARIIPLPSMALKFALVCATRLGLVAPGGHAFLSRLDRNQVFDGTAAASHIGWQPRGYRPVPDDFAGAAETVATQQS